MIKIQYSDLYEKLDVSYVGTNSIQIDFPTSLPNKDFENFMDNNPQLRRVLKSKKSKLPVQEIRLLITFGLILFIIVSYILLPEPIKLASVVFACPLFNQIYHLFKKT